MTRDKLVKTHNLVKALGLAALAVPFLAMIVLIGGNLLSLKNTEYRFAISGYDPRDLLRGHYLIFQYEWHDHAENLCSEKQEKNCCACMNNAASTTVSFMPCDTATQQNMCQASLPVDTFPNDRFQPHENLRRYYIPESHAKTLENMLRQNPQRFEIGIVPYNTNTRHISAKVKMLYIDNLALPEFLKIHTAD